MSQSLNIFRKDTAQMLPQLLMPISTLTLFTVLESRSWSSNPLLFFFHGHLNPRIGFDILHDMGGPDYFPDPGRTPGWFEPVLDNAALRMVQADCCEVLFSVGLPLPPAGGFADTPASPGTPIHCAEHPRAIAQPANLHGRLCASSRVRGGPDSIHWASHAGAAGLYRHVGGRSLFSNSIQGTGSAKSSSAAALPDCSRPIGGTY